MKLSRILSTFFASLLVASITFSLALSAMAQTTALKVLHSFTGGSDGGLPVAGVIFDSAGNIYGTTYKGGDTSACSGFGCGLVYKLTPTGTGRWTESPVYPFPQSEANGVYPTDLLFGPDGNLYGIDALGGATGSCINNQNCQIAFELSPTSTNYWKETVVQIFSNGVGGGFPSGLVADAAGNLYGTADGGTCCGLVFRLSPNGSGGWQETVLYDFSGTPDGNPLSPLIFDAAGNLYGTISVGGSNNAYCQKLSGCGVVFELSPTASGPWTETILYTFNGSTDGSSPQSGLTFDSAGNLYGTAVQGGNLTGCNTLGCGVIFKLSPSGSGWKETVLHAFTGHGDGLSPITAVTLDAAGNVYGGAFGGKPSTACSGGCGVIFKLAPRSTGGWSDTVLHTFTGSDGSVTEGVPDFRTGWQSLRDGLPRRHGNPGRSFLNCSVATR